MFFKKDRIHGLEIKHIIPSRLNEIEKDKLFKEIDDLIENAWGKFDLKFLENHLLKSTLISTARIRNELVGFCSISKKEIFKKKVYYFEFTIIRNDFQKLGLGTRLSFLALRRIMLKNIFQIIFKPIEIMFITPNIRVLAKVAALADFVYPNPYEADKATGKIIPADDETWGMARELIKISDNPNRRLDREGLVLHGSYSSMPWLIYDIDKIPWHRKDIINKFARRHLSYGKKEDKEFVVRVRVDILTLIKLSILLV